MNEESKLIIEDAIKRGIIKDTSEGYVLLSSELFLPSDNLTFDKSILFPQGKVCFSPNCNSMTYEGKDTFWKNIEAKHIQETVDN